MLIFCFRFLHECVGLLWSSCLHSSFVNDLPASVLPKSIHDRGIHETFGGYTNYTFGWCFPRCSVTKGATVLEP